MPILVFIAIALVVRVVYAAFHGDRPFMKLYWGRPNRRQYRAWARRPDVRLRQLVGHRTNDEKILQELAAAQEDSMVRLAVAANPKTPLAVWQQLVVDGDESVRKVALAHPSAPDHMRVIEGI